MRPHLSPVGRFPAEFVVTLLALAIVASPVSAADEASPSASPETQAVPTAEPAELGGAWRRTAAGPFGAVDLPGGWTGTELVVVDPQQKRRAAAYYPALNTWRTIARPPRKVQADSAAHWTDTELLFVEPRGAARRGLTAYDSIADAWRSTAPSPMNVITASVWTDDVLVVASGAKSATYDPATDTWTELPPVPVSEATTDTPTERPISLHWTGEEVYALITVPVSADDPPADADAEATLALAFAPLDRSEGTWGTPSTGPLTAMAAQPLWTGDSFTFLTGPGDTGDPLVGGPRDGHYDPDSDTWTITENACGIDTSDAVWAEPLILAVSQGRAYDPTAGQCYTLPVAPWPERSSALQTWTGHEVVEVSGTISEGSPPRRDGSAYSPFPEDDGLGVAVDVPSRPVRVQVPSLGIDLPVIRFGRPVKGSSPGYPACDVALYWTAFDLPGEPGTAWILAHSQEGMFLPLLEAARERGAKSLLGRRIELQLRDGRLFTYRIYRTNGRATNTNIGTRKRADGEHRLVLQTSTGTGSDPKLVVASRLVAVATTDEPRPRPKPRACG